MGELSLTKFLVSVAQARALVPTVIVNFVTPLSQPLFLAAVVSYAKQNSSYKVVVLPSGTSLSALQNQLEMSFLGESQIYIFDPGTEIALLEAAVLSYLSAYTGPHKVILFTLPEQRVTAQRGASQEAITEVVIEPTVDSMLYKNLYFFMHHQELVDTQFFQELVARVPGLPLNVACLMVQYQVVLGKNRQKFFSSWLKRIVEPKKSLFLLSQYFFAGDAQSFFPLLSELTLVYPAEFWLAYWSEQVWQAILFIHIARQQGPLIAKKSVSRLPFSFMQKDWQRHSAERLMTAHAALYKIDYALKNGTRTDGFVAWYAKFFA